MSEKAPNILNLNEPRAAMLYRATRSYACRSLQDNFDYAIAELILYQKIHGALLNGCDESEIVEAVYEVAADIDELIVRSIQEALND